MMTKLVLISLIFVSLKSFAQFEYIDQTELYKKYNITEVTAYFHDSSLVEKDEIWKIDSQGRVNYHELLPEVDDSSFSATIWEYKNHLLYSRKIIGIWNTKTNKVDTAHIEYFYDALGNTVSERHTHTKDKDTLLKTYQYFDGLLVSTKLYNQEQPFWFVVDSTVYYPNEVPKLKSTVKFYNNSPEYKKELFFDTLGILQTKIEYSYDGRVCTPNIVTIFIYDDEKLSRTKEVVLGTNFIKKVDTYERVYQYNDKGLLSKQLRLQGRRTINYDTFEYK